MVVSALRLVGCPFDLGRVWPETVKMEPTYLPLSIQGCTWGVRSLNDSQVQYCCWPVLPQGMTGWMQRTIFFASNWICSLGIYLFWKYVLKVIVLELILSSPPMFMTPPLKIIPVLFIFPSLWETGGRNHIYQKPFWRRSCKQRAQCAACCRVHTHRSAGYKLELNSKRNKRLLFVCYVDCGF